MPDVYKRQPYGDAGDEVAQKGAGVVMPEAQNGSREIFVDVCGEFHRESGG